MTILHVTYVLSCVATPLPLLPRQNWQIRFPQYRLFPSMCIQPEGAHTFRHAAPSTIIAPQPVFGLGPDVREPVQGSNLDQGRPAEEDGAVAAYNDRLVRHCWHVCAAGRARADDHRHLRQASGRQARLQRRWHKTLVDALLPYNRRACMQVPPTLVGPLLLGQQASLRCCHFHYLLFTMKDAAALLGAAVEAVAGQRGHKRIVDAGSPYEHVLPLACPPGCCACP